MKATSGITREELEAWGGKEVFNQGLALCNSGDVSDVRYDDETLTVSGKIQQRGGWAMPVSFTLTRASCVRSHCPCAANQRFGRICEHVLAVGIALWVMESEEAEKRERGEGENGTGRWRSEVEVENGMVNHHSPPQASTSTFNSTPTSASPSFIEVPMAPKFYAFLSGSRAALSVELDAWYGDIDFPACSVQAERTVYLEDPDDALVRRTRSVKAERAAVDELRGWGFEPGYRDGDLKLYLTNPQKVLAFLGSGYPKLRRRADWEIQLSDRLSSLMNTFRTIVPVVKVKDAPGGAFDVSYEFDAQGEDVSPAEIQAALNRGDGCLLREGQVYLLDGDAIEKMQGVFSDCAATQGGAERGWFRVKGVYAPYVRASLESILDAVDLDDSRAASWRESAAKRGDPDAKFEPVALGTLDKVLRPYQKQGVYWMRFLEEAGLCGLLADEMGLGKTLQTLTWLSLPHSRWRPEVEVENGMSNFHSPPQASTSTSEPTRPSLIVCPTSLVRNWEAEAKKFTPQLKTLVVSGPDRARDFRRMDGFDLVVTSYALLQRDFDEAYLGRRFGAVVLDEAQHIKNRETKNAKAVKLLQADRKLALTGTPVENSVADVWSIFDFLMPDYLGDYETFKLNFENPIRESGDAATLEKLKRKIAPFILRRVKKSVAKDLPDKIVKVSYCPMSDDAQRDYVSALAKTRREAGSVVREKGFAKAKFELLAMLMRLRQIAARAKVEPFMEQLVSAVEGGHKILVFSQFVKMLKVLADELDRAGIPFCYLDGATKDRLGECNRFNQDPKVPVFLISLMAGGTGLNLTGADMVIHYDPWWNPAVEDQATDRAHRIGQKKTVYVMKMIASGTIEEKVLALQRRKQAVISATVSTTDAQVMETLTAADLNELLS